jgi:micrococcal nuclease
MRAPDRIIVAALVLAAILVAVLLRNEERPGASLPAGIGGTHAVTRVYDGDTIEVEGFGKVRLLGIDAMDGYEEARTERQARYYGMSAAQVRHWAEEATAFARSRLAGRRVEVRVGGDVVDDYGRTLAYVHVHDDAQTESADFNLLMLEAGLAAAYRRYEHDRRDQYIRAEERARAMGMGMWSDARSVR